MARKRIWELDVTGPAVAGMLVGIASIFAVVACSGADFEPSGPLALPQAGSPGSGAGHGGASAGSGSGGSSTGSGGASAGDGGAGAVSQSGGVGGGNAGGDAGAGTAGSGNGGGDAGAGTSGSGNGGSAGAGGSGGSGGEPQLDPCNVPRATMINCDGVCGEPSAACGACNDFIAFDGGHFIFANQPASKRTCPCSGVTARISVPAGKCVRATVQPGAIIHMTTLEAACESAVFHENCLTVIGMNGGVATEKAIYVTYPNVDAWVRTELADALGENCQLSCN